jgi:hypothetical protein
VAQATPMKPRWQHGRMYTLRRMRLGLGKPGPDFLFAAKCFFDDFRLHLDEIGFSILNRVKNFVCGNPHPRLRRRNAGLARAGIAEV